MFSYTVYPITRSVGQAYGVPPVGGVTPVKPVHNSKTVRPLKSVHTFQIFSKSPVQSRQQGAEQPSVTATAAAERGAAEPGGVGEIQLMHAAPLLAQCRAPAIAPEQDVVAPYALRLDALRRER